MWKCYYCSGTNKHDWWKCNWCNAPKREPEFVGTPGYDSGYGILSAPYYFKGGTSLPSSTARISIEGRWDTWISDNVAYSMTEPEDAYLETVPAISRHTGVCEMVPVTNYKPARSNIYLGLVNWMKGKMHESK